MSEELARFFEPPEAEAMLPELDGLLAEAQALLTRLEEARRRLSEPARANGHVILNDSSAVAWTNRATTSRAPGGHADRSTRSAMIR